LGIVTRRRRRNKSWEAGQKQQGHERKTTVGGEEADPRRTKMAGEEWGKPTTGRRKGLGDGRSPDKSQQRLGKEDLPQGLTRNWVTGRVSKDD